MNVKDEPILKEWAYLAIAKHARKIFDREAGVIRDKDPEDLHQMRVGMRRLRSAIAGLGLALDLPKAVSEKKIAMIGRSLGNLRDLDVLLAALDSYRSLLPAAEQKSLDKVLKTLNKERQHELRQVKKTLDSKLYLHLKQGLQNWLEQPKYRTIGDFALYPLLPDLLLPQISQFFLHPAWLVGVELEAGRVRLAKIPNTKEVELILEREATILHELRKTAKKTRYNLELFERFYAAAYRDYVEKITQIQEVLGQIQDSYVLRSVLERSLKAAIAEQMPELATLLTQTRYQKWQEWSILQLQFLEDKTRSELRQIVQHPVSSEREIEG